MSDDDRDGGIVSLDGAATPAGFKQRLTDQERQDFEGPGTRTFAGKELLWRTDTGVHAVEAAQVVPDIMLAWTLCGIDLPGAAALLPIRDEVDCVVCALRRVLPDPERPTYPYKARPSKAQRQRVLKARRRTVH
jgi:hypothetical protein